MVAPHSCWNMPCSYAVQVRRLECADRHVPVDLPFMLTSSDPPRSYCKNLDFAQQQSAPFTPGQYVDYDCVLPLGSLLWILFAEVRGRPLCLGSRVCRQVTRNPTAVQHFVDAVDRGARSHVHIVCT